ncbi:MAG: electron transport complex subunit RsxB [Fluviicoccus sp.]|nr:electron transport complex subunit RsxB [Fluviicoccus sp.]MDO8329134.1 electron transport complex subunit RsxB [Fluviicoccus sp.]
MTPFLIALGIALLAVLVLALLSGSLLGFAAERFRVDADPIVDQIDALLPQTQCGQCGHPGCHPYAEAIAGGEAINHCVPGGQDAINKIAALLGVDPLPLDSEYGAESEVKKVAFIREEECIGCTKCIQACPVDAIIGAAKHTHTVIVSECTGCDLCVEPCPVDCIDMIPVPVTRSTWHWSPPPGVGASPARQAHAANRIAVHQLG